MNLMSKHAQSAKMSRAAFTLVEVVIALGLMILSLAAFIGVFVMASRSAVVAENRVKAVHDARKQMERLSACRYADAALSLGAHTTDLAGVSYSVAIFSNSLYMVKNIAVTSIWTNAAGSITSIYVLTGSMSSELHQ